MAFSIHKMMGPSGMGGLWGKMDLLENMRSIQSGGSICRDLTLRFTGMVKTTSKI
ncbi:MAG: hypothetical protein CM15mP71_5390 [Candidatus Poseidoniales archaeon]|nr:MAG: hypothetical protein CM15mP71_5390 [Candidatus Poseidoniales archaeon]